jgi:hypothetical protein
MFVLVSINFGPLKSKGSDKLAQLADVRRHITQLEAAISDLEAALSTRLINGSFAGLTDTNGNQGGYQLPSDITVFDSDNEQTTRDALSRVRADLGLARTEESALQSQIDEDKKAIGSTKSLQQGGGG